MKSSLVLGRQYGGLYFVDHNPQRFSSQVENHIPQHSVPTWKVSVGTGSSNKCGFALAQLWHCRLGHIPFDKLINIDVIGCKQIRSDVCKVCPTARQTRTPFPHSVIKTVCIFKMIHVDIWGAI